MHGQNWQPVCHKRHARDVYARAMYKTRVRAMRVLCLGLIAIALAIPSRAAEHNDYPTVARADYVFACMKTNGETRQALEQCSCSIDIIASILPYDRYVSAETVLSLSQVPGRFGAMFSRPSKPDPQSMICGVRRPRPGSAASNLITTSTQ